MWELQVCMYLHFFSLPGFWGWRVKCCCKFTESALKFPPQMKITDSSKPTYTGYSITAVFISEGFSKCCSQSFFRLILWGKYINLPLLIFSLSFGNHCFYMGLEPPTGLELEAVVLIHCSWPTEILTFFFVCFLSRCPHWSSTSSTCKIQREEDAHALQETLSPGALFSRDLHPSRYVLSEHREVPELPSQAGPAPSQQMPKARLDRTAWDSWRCPCPKLLVGCTGVLYHGCISL